MNKKSQESRRQPTSPSVDRAVLILKVLSENPKIPMGPSELSRQTNIPKSTLLNICNALMDGEMLRQTDRGYALGRRLAQMGQSYLASVEVVEEFYDSCRNLLSDVFHTAQLSVLGDGMNVIYLARQDGRDPLHLGLTSEIGRSVPAHCTASGKIMLAALEEDLLEERLSTKNRLLQFTDNTITSYENLREEIQRIRDNGYAHDDEEVIPGLYCLSVAINTPQREDGLLAVSFTFRKTAIRSLNMNMALEQLKSFATELAKRISGKVFLGITSK